MKPNSRNCLCLPGESGREQWTMMGDAGWQKQGGTADSGGCILAVEIMAMDSVPLWVVAPAEGRVDVKSVASLRWELLGIDNSTEGKGWVHWVAGEQDRRILVATAGLSAEAPVEEWIGFKPESFEMSPRLFPIPPNEIAVWMELGRYVIAFHRGDQLVHFSALSARILDAEAATEIHDLVMALETHEFITKIKGARIWTLCEPEFTDSLKQVLATQVYLEPKPSPRLPVDGCGLFPPEVVQVRREQAAVHRKARIIFTAAALYLLIFGIWAGWLFWREQRLNQNTALLNLRRPEVEAMRAVRMKWSALEAATNVDAFPVEVFYRVQSLLPNEGIQLKEFQLELEKLVVSGEASSVNHALKFKADLTSNEGLKQYTWNFPQPMIKEDNRASFRAEGTLTAGGEAHEGQ